MSMSSNVATGSVTAAPPYPAMRVLAVVGASVVIYFAGSWFLVALLSLPGIQWGGIVLIHWLYAAGMTLIAFADGAMAGALLPRRWVWAAFAPGGFYLFLAIATNRPQALWEGGGCPLALTAAVLGGALASRRRQRAARNSDTV